MIRITKFTINMLQHVIIEVAFHFFLTDMAEIKIKHTWNIVRGESLKVLCSFYALYKFTFFVFCFLKSKKTTVSVMSDK